MISEKEVLYDSIKAFLATPESPKLAVIVVHEIWGLNDNIRDVARRLANEGFGAFAPHLYRESVLTPEKHSEGYDESLELATREKKRS